jgi:hypothetical protein
VLLFFEASMADFIPMDPKEATALVLDRRAFIAKTSAVGIGLGLGACATTPPPLTIDPAYLRTEVPYNGREAPGTLVVDPQNHYLYLVQKTAVRCATESASARRVLAGLVWRPCAANRNGRIGIQPRRCFSASLNSEEQ